MCAWVVLLFCRKSEEKEKIMEQIYRIGIDHGYGNIKTAHHIFESGIIQRESISELVGMVVEYEGKFYEIGSTHKEYQYRLAVFRILLPSVKSLSSSL